MNNELLGTQIAKYRKAAGITQEELGRAVGVSTQAVSRWECGGAPDVSLLPAIADKLGVSIGALFGRSEENAQDIYKTFISWLMSIPLSRRMEETFQLIAATQDLFHNESTPNFDIEDYKRFSAGSSFTAGHDLMRSAYSLKEGIALAVPGNDCPFYLLMPEPEEGYEANLLTAEEYRELFQLLSRPGALDMLLFLHRQGYRYFTLYALAKHADLDPREAGPLLDALARANLLDTQTIESEKGIESIYAYRNAYGFIPFLFLARWIVDPSNSWRAIWTNRDKPILRPGETAEKKK